MARPTARPPQRKSSTLRAVKAIFGNEYLSVLGTSPAIQQPLKEARNSTNVVSKGRQTVSAAGVFKKKPKAVNGKKKQGRKEVTKKPDLFLDFKEGLEEARSTLHANSKTTFDAVHDDFIERLVSSRATDEVFFEAISAHAATLSAPLGEEQIETTFTREGKKVIEVVQIGKRIALFKKSVEKEEAKLKDYWKQWEEMQNEYVDLGTEVFGPKAFGVDSAAGRGIEKGFKKEMELFDLEHGVRVEELAEEIEDVSLKILQKMKTSEKELDAVAKREQAKLLQAIIQD